MVIIGFFAPFFLLSINLRVFSSPNLSPIPGLDSIEENQWRMEIQSIEEKKEELEEQYSIEQSISPYSSSEEAGGIDPSFYDQAILSLETSRVEWIERFKVAKKSWDDSFTEIERLEQIVRDDLLDEMDGFLTFLRTQSFSQSIISEFLAFKSRMESLIDAESQFGSIAQEIANYLNSQASLLGTQVEAFRTQIFRNTSHSETIINTDSNYFSDFLNALKRFVIEGNSSDAASHLTSNLNLRIIGLNENLVINSIQTGSLSASTPDHLRQTQWNQDHFNPFVELGGSFAEQGDSFRFYKRNDWLVWGVIVLPVQTTLSEANLHVHVDLTLKDKIAEQNAGIFESYRIQVSAEAQKWQNERLHNARTWDERKLKIIQEKTDLETRKVEIEKSTANQFRERKIALEKAKEENSYQAVMSVLEDRSLESSSEIQGFFRATDNYNQTSTTELAQFHSQQATVWDGLTRIATIQEMENQTVQNEKDSIAEYIKSLQESREFKPDTALAILNKFQKDGECLDSRGRIKESCKAEYEANTNKTYSSVELSNGKIIVSKNIHSGESKFNGGDATQYSNYEAGKTRAYFELELPSQTKRVDFTKNESNSLFSALSGTELSSVWSQFGKNQSKFANSLYQMESSQAWSSALRNLNERDSYAYNVFQRKTEEAIEIQTVINQLIEHLYKGGSFKAFTQNFKEQKIIERATQDLAQSSGLSKDFISSVLNGMANERAKKIAERKSKDRQMLLAGAGALTALVSIIPGVNLGAVAWYAGLVAGTAGGIDQVANGGKFSTKFHKGALALNNHLSGADLQADLKRADFGGQMRAIVENEMMRGAAFELSQTTGLSAKDLEVLMRGVISEKERKKQKEKEKVQKGIQAAQMGLYVGSMILAPGLAPSLQNFMPTLQNIANMSMTAVDYARMASLALSTASGYVNGGAKGALGAMASSVSLPIPKVGSILPNIQWDPTKKTWNAGFQVALANSNGLRFGTDGRGSASFEKDFLPSGGGSPISLNLQAGRNYSIGLNRSFGGGNSMGIQFGNHGLQFQGEFSPDANNFVGFQMGLNGNTNLSLGQDDIEFFQMQGNLFDKKFQGGLATDLGEQLRNLAFRRTDATDFDAWKDKRSSDVIREAKTDSGLPFGAISSVSFGLLSLAGGARLLQNQSKVSESKVNPTSPQKAQVSTKIEAIQNLQKNGKLTAENVKNINSKIKELSAKDISEWRRVTAASQTPLKKLSLRTDINPVQMKVKSKPEMVVFANDKQTQDAISRFASAIANTEPKLDIIHLESHEQQKLDTLNKQKKNLELERELAWSKMQNTFVDSPKDNPASVVSSKPNQAISLSPDQKRIIREDNAFQKETASKIKAIDREVSKLINLELKRRDEIKGIAILNEIHSDPELQKSLDPKVKANLESYIRAEQKYRTLKNDPEPNAKEITDAQKRLDQARQAIEPNIKSVLKISDELNAKGGKLDTVIRDVKALTEKDTFVRVQPAEEKTISIPVYQNKDTGEIQIGAGLITQDFVEAGLEHNQGERSEGLEKAKEIARSLDLPEPQGLKIKNNWCVAFSCWTTLRRELGPAVVPEFKDFVKSMTDCGYLNKETMYFENTESAMNHYASSENLNYRRQALPENRNESYSMLAEKLRSLDSNSVTLRVKDDRKEGSHQGHTISLVRNEDQKTWTVIDTANKELNGTKFDPAKWQDSLLGNPSNSPYKDHSPYRVDFLQKAS